MSNKNRIDLEANGFGSQLVVLRVKGGNLKKRTSHGCPFCSWLVAACLSNIKTAKALGAETMEPGFFPGPRV